jgi:hypothetical protein
MKGERKGKLGYGRNTGLENFKFESLDKYLY